MYSAAREGGDGGVVRDEDEGRAALAPEVDEDVQDRRARRAVEVSRRLVGEEKRRPRSEGPGERHALLLASRELGGVVVPALGEADGRQELGRARPGGGMSCQLERQQDVLAGRHVREELVRLEDEADLPAAQEGQVVFRHRVDRRALQEDLPSRRPVEAGHEAEERRLAAARRAEDGGELTRGDGQVDVVEDPEHPAAGRELFRDAAKLEEGCHGGEESRTAVTSAAVRRVVFLALALGAFFLAGCGPGKDSGSSVSRDRVSLNPGAAPADTATGDRPDAAPAAPPVPADAPLVVFLGDSLTAGLGLPVDQAFPAVVASELAKKGRPIRVVNAGVSGDTTAGGLRRAEWVLSQRPDVVVLALGANDGLRGLPVEETEKNLRGIAAKARLAGARVLLCGMLIPTSYGPEYEERFGRLFPRVAKEDGLPLVPFLLEGVAGRKELNLEDGIHPNPEGQKILAANVLPGLEAILVTLAPRGR